MVNNSCLEDESEVVLGRDEEEDGAFWVDFVFQPNNLTLSTKIEAGGEVKKCPNQEPEKERKKITASSSWPAVAGVFMAACFSLVGCFHFDSYAPCTGLKLALIFQLIIDKQLIPKLYITSSPI